MVFSSSIDGGRLAKDPIDNRPNALDYISGIIREADARAVVSAAPTVLTDRAATRRGTAIPQEVPTEPRQVRVNPDPIMSVLAVTAIIFDFGVACRQGCDGGLVRADHRVPPAELV